MKIISTMIHWLVLLTALLFGALADAQTQPVGTGINMAKQSASAPGPVGTDRVWPNSTGDVLEWTDASNVTHTLATGGGVDGLKSPYLAATSASNNIITETTSLGPIIFRAPVSPSGPQFEIANNAGSTNYFSVATTTITMGAVIRVDVPGIGSSNGTLDVASAPTSNGYISGDNIAAGGTEGTGYLVLASHHGSTASILEVNDAGGYWGNRGGLSISVGLNTTSGNVSIFDSATDADPVLVLDTDSVWGNTNSLFEIKNHGTAKVDFYGNGDGSMNGLTLASTLTMAAGDNIRMATDSSASPLRITSSNGANSWVQFFTTNGFTVFSGDTGSGNATIQAQSSQSSISPGTDVPTAILYNSDSTAGNFSALDFSSVDSSSDESTFGRIATVVDDHDIGGGAGNAHMYFYIADVNGNMVNALTLNGGASGGTVTIPQGLELDGNLSFSKEVNHSIFVEDSTTADTDGGKLSQHSGRATSGNANGGDFVIDAERGVGTGLSGQIRIGMGDSTGGVQAVQFFLGASSNAHIDIAGVDVFESNLSGSSAGTLIDAPGANPIQVGFSHGSSVEIYPPARMRGETEVIAEFSVIGETHLDESLIMNITSSAIDYTMLSTDLGIQFTAPGKTLTLLTTASAGNRDLFVQDASGAISPSSPLTIATTGGDTINGASSIKLTVPYSGVWIRSTQNTGFWYAWASNETTAGLQTTTGVVNVSSATAPSSGYVLTATDSTHATWQPGGGGGGNSFTYTEQSTPSTPASGALTCWANGTGTTPNHTTSLYCMSHDGTPISIFTSGTY